MNDDRRRNEDQPMTDDPAPTSPRPVALITGAAGGLGRVLAADLAADGWDLALIGSNAGRLAELKAELGLPDDRVVGLTVDLRDADVAVDAVAAVYQRYGRVDALAHLVGGWTGGTRIVDADDDPYAAMLDQHLWSTLNVVRALVPRMVRAGHGRIAAVSSPMAAAPDAGMSAYAVGKAAQETLLAALAQELVGTGVTANVVRVRAIDTGGVREADPHGKGASMTTPAEISAAIRYLFSAEARVVNGQRISLHSGI
jgi:NAD(P)-dependent dehydrogenase (short-subunit alcohol dehydrogenase family)